MMNHEQHIESNRDSRLILKITLAVLAGAAVITVLSGYGQFLLNALPLLLLLACPLLHFFGHGKNHGRH